MDGDFLSNIIVFDELHKSGYLNLIVAPCGSGKTTLALNHLAPMYGNPARALYLIDTVAGQDQLLQNPKFRCYDKDWRKDYADTPLKDDGKIVVMTADSKTVMPYKRRNYGNIRSKLACKFVC